MDLIKLVKSGTGTAVAGSMAGKTGWALGVCCRFRSAFAAVFVALLLVAGAHAQTGQGSVTGTVTDAQGARVGNADVIVTNTETGVAQKTKSDKSGIYIVSSINPGPYRVQVNKSGFQGSETSDVRVSTGQTTTTDVRLKTGSDTTTVTVEATGNDLSTTTSNVATTVEHHLVEDLPYPERSALEAVLLVPGVTGDPLQPGGVASENPNYATGYTTPGASLRVGGSSPGKSVILVDGTDVTQASFPRAGINLSGDLVQESTVIVSGASAAYGRTGGGVIVQSSKAGTNNLHGGIDYRHTDPFFNAFPLGTQARSALHQNFYSAYLGGPVFIPKIYNGKEKTFFFVGYEPARLRSGISVLETLPTADELNGHLMNGLASINTTILKNSGYAAALAALRVNHVYEKYQPGTLAPGGCSPVAVTVTSLVTFPCGPVLPAATSPPIPIMNPTTQEPDDVSPQLALNPFAQFVLAHYPSPSNPGPFVTYLNSDGSYNQLGQNATVARGVLNKDNRYSARIDHQISNTDRVFARYTSIPVYANRYFGFAADNPINPQPSDNALSQNAVLSYTHVFGNNIVNEMHYTYLRDEDPRSPSPASLSQDYAGQLGLTPASTGGGFPGIGSLIVSGYTGLSAGLTVSAISGVTNIDENFDFVDNLQITHGKHLFQMGGDIRRIESNEYNTGYGFGGGYSFAQSLTNNGSTGGSPEASLALGLINTFQYSPTVIPAYYRWHYYAGYFQDDWRILPTVTLNLGLRYEVETPRREKFDNQAFIDPTQTYTAPNGQVGQGAFCFSGSCGNGSTLFPINYKGVEPRIGIAWAPKPKMTVRASYGLVRVPLTGYENLPDPNFSATSNSIGGVTGCTVANSACDYLSNPVNPATLTSAYTALNGSRGPFFTATGLTVPYVVQNDTVPSIQQYSMTVQFQPIPKTLIQVGYAGLSGKNGVQPFSPTTGTAINVPSLAAIQGFIAGHVNTNATVPNTLGISVGGAVQTETIYQKAEPYQGFFAQPLYEAYERDGKSNYNALLMSVRQAYGNGLSLLAGYTWSKTIANYSDTNSGTSGGSGNATGEDPQDTTLDRSVAIYDQPSSFRTGFTYKLPIGIGKLVNTRSRGLDGAVGGISVSGILTSQSGFPNYVTLGTPGYFVSFVNSTTINATTATTPLTELPTGITVRPNIVPGVPLINPNWKRDPFGVNGGTYLNPAAFAVPGSINNPQFGNAPRAITAARSPRELLFDASVRKQFYFENPRYRLEIKGTFSNVMNHPVYFGVNNHNAFATGSLVSTATAPATGYLQNAAFGPLNPGQSASLSRVIQVGGRFSF